MSERKTRTHSYHNFVDLPIELALECENDSHMERYLHQPQAAMPLFGFPRAP